MALISVSSVVSAILAIALYQLYSTWSKHRSIPGPVLAALSNFPRLFWTWRDQPFDVYIDLHKKYGPIVRYGPNAVSISDVTELPNIYGFHYNYEKSDLYKVMLPYMNGEAMTGTISPMPADMHKKIKAPAVKIFATTNMRQFEEYIDNSIELLTKRLDELFLNRSFDFAFWANLFSHDTLGELTFSKKYGHMEAGKDVDNIIADVEKHFQKISLIGQIPWYDLTLRITPLQSKFFKQPDSPQIVFQMARTFERQALLQSGEPLTGLAGRDLLTQFMKAEAADSTLPPMVSVMWIATNIGAGSGTTAALLCSVVYFIARNPDTYQKLMEELRGASLDTPTSLAQIQRLPYLNACIKEAERLHPGVGLHLERVVPKGGTVICGTYLPEGTTVGANPWVTNRDKGIYGSDAEIWRPERWLCDDVSRRKMEQTLLSFGAGSRVCYGAALAHLIVSKTVATLFLTYKIHIENADKGWTSCGRWFTGQSNTLARIEKLVE